jgi:hypothetical protein
MKSPGFNNPNEGMAEKARKQTWNLRFSRPFGTRQGFGTSYSTLKGWAIFIHPSGMRFQILTPGEVRALPGTQSR